MNRYSPSTSTDVWFFSIFPGMMFPGGSQQNNGRDPFGFDDEAAHLLLSPGLGGAYCHVFSDRRWKWGCFGVLFVFGMTAPDVWRGFCRGTSPQSHRGSSSLVIRAGSPPACGNTTLSTAPSEARKSEAPPTLLLSPPIPSCFTMKELWNLQTASL